MVGVDYLAVCDAGVDAGDGDAATAARVAAGLRDVLAGRAGTFSLDYQLIDPRFGVSGDLTGRWFQVQIVPLQGRPGAVVAHTDITPRKRTEAALLYQAGHDPLTGLLNRNGLLHLLADVLPSRHESATALVFTDLDGFKAVNDGLGHAAGDEVLVEATRRLRAIVGDAPIARTGGDEFAILLRSSGRSRACALALRVIEALREPFDVASLCLRVSASVGIALADATHRTPGDLLRDADAAMYEAKARGRDRFAVFDRDLRERALRRVTMLDRLRSAVNHPVESGLSLHYQPLVSFADRQVLGLEALARWTDDTLGDVAPGEFIEVAEDSGLIMTFGQWALERACRDSARSGLQVSVNVSARQLADARFVDVVEHALVRSRLPAHRLCLELTESAVLGDLDVAGSRLGLLRRRGVQVALDDFGTGWSSLGQLRRLPVDRLKVDRSFVEALGRDGGATAVISAIVALARGLGMRVTAEGVETEDQFARLRDLGCHDAQGFRLGVPAPLAVALDGSARHVVLPADDPTSTEAARLLRPRSPTSRLGR
jgi:diguanylate cyclase (GGDEF)-like protein